MIFLSGEMLMLNKLCPAIQQPGLFASYPYKKGSKCRLLSLV